MPQGVRAGFSASGHNSSSLARSVGRLTMASILAAHLSLRQIEGAKAVLWSWCAGYAGGWRLKAAPTAAGAGQRRAPAFSLRSGLSLDRAWRLRHRSNTFVG